MLLSAPLSTRLCPKSDQSRCHLNSELCGLCALQGSVDCNVVNPPQLQDGVVPTAQFLLRQTNGGEARPANKL